MKGEDISLIECGACGSKTEPNSATRRLSSRLIVDHIGLKEPDNIDLCRECTRALLKAIRNSQDT